MIKGEINKLIKSLVKTLQKEGKLPEFKIPEFAVEPSRERSYGDYATNIALQIAKIIKKDPMEIAGKLGAELRVAGFYLFEKVETAKPGFINFFISKEYLQKQLEEILKLKGKFGVLEIGKNKKINVEFISANPTGPLTLGNGRGGFCGDVLANVFEKAGFEVIREYYINDRGEQVVKLGHSVIGNEPIYKGEYIDDLKKKISGVNPEEVGEKAAGIILEKMIKPTIKKMGIKFDVWFSEKSLYKKKEAENVLKTLKKKKLVYEKEGALWFKSTKFGDDKDRVLVKKDGEETYFTSDIAYLKNKFKRGFKQLIFFIGADHYGYVPRLKAAVEVLGYKKGQLKPIVMQLVRLFQKGKEVRMSKRAGIYVTLDELINEVGLDVARFFFLTKSPETHLNFNLDLAKEQSEKNPVYYIQYAYARICSILRKCEIQKPKIEKQHLRLLTHNSELELIKQLIKLPEIVEDTAKDYQVQRLPQYAVNLADAFHGFYENCRVLCDDEKLRSCRLDLVLATKIVLKNTLDLMGISAPEKM